MFISWIKYQRRNATICERYDLKKINLYYNWQKKSIFHKVIGTLFKVCVTLKMLYKTDNVIFVQIPSVFLLYTATLSKFLSPNIKLIADCHNNIFYDSLWSKFPFVIYCLSKFNRVVAHNDDVLKHMNHRFHKLNNIIIVKDLIPNFSLELSTSIEKRELKFKNFIFIPCSLGSDEPVVEMLEAIALCEDINFVITKNIEQLNDRVHHEVVIPSNLKCVGFLNETVFNKFLISCSAVLVLTSRQGTQPSGAVEALGAKKPVIISDIATTRKLYNGVAFFCRNEKNAIAKAVNDAYVSEPIDFEKAITEYEKDSILQLNKVLLSE